MPINLHAQLTACGFAFCTFHIPGLSFHQVGEVGPDSFSVYLIPETLRVTILGDRKVGDAINIEIDSQTQVRSCSCRRGPPFGCQRERR